MVFLSPAKKDAPNETMQKINVGRGWSSKQGSGKAHPSLPGRLSEKLKENLLLEAKNVDGDKNRKSFLLARRCPPGLFP